MLTLYHNPRCGKSRTAKKCLEEKKTPFKVKEYLNGITKKEIQTLLNKGILFKDLLRTKEEEYKQHIGNKDLTEKQIIKQITLHPKIFQRPIIESKKKAIIARDDESLKQAINL